MSASGGKILVVDDDQQLRHIFSRMLHAAGYETVEAPDGEAAAKLLSAEFDLVLTDLEMPGSVDGNELTRRVKAGSRSDVVIMTGNPGLESAVQALRDGAYDYLTKPFGEEALLHTVRRCMDRRGLSKELAREKELRSELDRAYSELSAMERLRDSFGQFVAPEVARFVLANPGSVSGKGELKTLTVLFADVRSFTPFAAEVPPEEAVSALNEIFACAIEAVRAEGGILNKFIGDGMMALFGAPAPIEDHAGAAAKAALSAMRAIESLAREREAKGRIALRAGMGLNSGPMIAGCLGTAERMEYSVIGGAVNLASRLESAAKPSQILAGPETAKLLAGRFKVKDLGLMTLKGFPEPVRAAEIA